MQQMGSSGSATAFSVSTACQIGLQLLSVRKLPKCTCSAADLKLSLCDDRLPYTAPALVKHMDTLSEKIDKVGLVIKRGSGN